MWRITVFTCLCFGYILQDRHSLHRHFTAFVLAISLTVGCSIGQHLIVGTDIAVVILIINVLVFLEETLFCQGAFVWQKRFDSLIDQKFCYTGSFISCIAYQRLYSDPFYLVI